MRDFLKEAGYKALEASLGRRNVARLGRYLSNRARFDVRNDIQTNGELVVLDAALRNFAEASIFIALDIGANVGAWTRALLERIPEGGASARVFAFEPVAGTRAILEERVGSSRGNARVSIVPFALSNEVARRPMFVLGDGAGTNSLHAGDPFVIRTEEVATDTVDLFCQRESIEHVDLMKVDTEGHDFAVLEGAGGMLARAAIEVVQFEYNHRWIDARHYLRDAFELLTPLGYRIGKVTPFGVEFYGRWHPELETFREGNYVACPVSRAGRFPTVRWWNE